MKQYKVTCKKCKESDVLLIDERDHRVIGTQRLMDTPFLAFRWRGDMNWGFSCKCGNDSRLAQSEAKDFTKLVAGTPDALKRIKASLKFPDKVKFAMESA